MTSLKNLFQTLLYADKSSDPNIQINTVFETHPEISIDIFSQTEVDKVLSAMKPVWKLPEVRKVSRAFLCTGF